MNYRFQLYISLLLFIFFVPLCEAQNADNTDKGESIRVDIIMAPLDNQLNTLVAAQKTIAETTALNLHFLGNYKVDIVKASEGVDTYRKSLKPGSVDRLLVVRIEQVEDQYRISTEVLNPLDGTQELSRSRLIESYLSVFDVVDSLVPELLGEVAGRRIAFGSLDVKVTEWDRSSLVDLSISSVPQVPEKESIESYPFPHELENNTIEVYVDGTKVAEKTGLIERVLTGERRIRVIETRGERSVVVFDEMFSISKDQTVSIRVDIPLLSEERKERVEELITREDFSELRSYIQRLTSHTPPLQEMLPYLEIGVSMKVLSEIEEEIENNLGVKKEDVRFILKSVKNKVARIRERFSFGTEKATQELNVLEENLNYMTEGYLRHLVLHSLYKSYINSDWLDLEREYTSLERTARYLDHTPPWFSEDVKSIDEYFDAYRSESNERPALYRTLTWGGALLTAAGGGSWYIGFTKAEEAAELYEEYETARSPEEADDLHSKVKKTQRISNVLQISAYAAAGIGLGSMVLRPFLRNGDKKKPQLRLKARLEGYFEERLKTAEELYGLRGGDEQYLEKLVSKNFE